MIKPSAPVRHYPFGRYWTKRIVPHLADPEFRRIMKRDLNLYARGLGWKIRVEHGDLPERFDCCDWRCNRPGRHPRWWAYACSQACHWCVNFNLRLAMLAEPRRPWRIITSDLHSTVWDGDGLLWDLTFAATGIDPDEAFEMARGRILKPGRYRRCGLAIPRA